MYAIRLNARNGQQLDEHREARFPEGFEIVALADSDAAELALNPHWTTHKANAPASDACLAAMWADSAIIRDNRDGALYVVDRASAEALAAAMVGGEPPTIVVHWPEGCQPYTSECTLGEATRRIEGRMRGSGDAAFLLALAQQAAEGDSVECEGLRWDVVSRDGDATTYRLRT